MLLALVNIASWCDVPPLVVTLVAAFVETAAGSEGAFGTATPALAGGVETAAAPDCGANRNAEGGRPPSVCASAAFMAYGTLSSKTRGCSACPCTCTPSHRASPAANRSVVSPWLVVEPSITE